MPKTIYEKNYALLTQLSIVVNGKLREDGKSKSDGFMDLVFEKLPHYDNFVSEGSFAFSIAHYFEQNGDLCQDPEMVLFVYPEREMVEAYYFQQALPPIFQEVYLDKDTYYPALKKELNSFLKIWLNNLVQQGHGQEWHSENKEAA